MKQQLTSEAKAGAELQPEHVAEQSLNPGVQFESVESLIRCDAAMTVVPPRLRERLLRDTVRTRPWWRGWPR